MTMPINDVAFYTLALLALAGGVGVIFSNNPIYSALNLVLTMIGVSGLFATLNAYFLAGVQLIVYAGAVLVLFVMVLMLFDLKHEMKTFSRGFISGLLKLTSLCLILGLLAGAAWISGETFFAPVSTEPERAMSSTKALAEILFTKYLFAFEAVGVLLLIVAVGAVALSRMTGGTHADH